MSKVLKTVAVIAIAVAVVVYAAPIAAALAAAAGSIGVTVAAAGIASALVGMGLSLGLTAAMGLFRKSPNMSQAIADRLNTSVIPSAPRKIVFGTTAGGQDVRFFEGDVDLPSTKKDGYAQVIALASHRIHAFRAFYAENDLIWQNGTWLRDRDGFANSNPLRFVLEGTRTNGFAVGSGRYWTNSASFTGCAYYSLFWRLDADGPFPSGPPARLTAVVDGCPVYDPRRDSSRGGSGSHRADNQATWQFQEGGLAVGRNPALALLTYLIGWRINGQLCWGMGVPLDRIDLDNFRTYANLCEEQVATKAGTTVQRYTHDGIYSTADASETVISSITASMGSCKLTDAAGLYGLIGGYDDTAGPRIAFDENDLVSAGGGASPYVWNPAPPSRERYNIVRGRFADPQNLYQLTDWGQPIAIEPLPDNVPRTMTLDLGGVSRPETCQRIAKQFLLREALTPGMFTALFGPKGFAVQVGSVLELSLASEGWNRKLFRVIEHAETHDLLFQMSLREEDPAVYAWDREEKPLPPLVRPQGYDPTTTITPQNLALSSASYPGANNYDVSEVHVTWTPEMSGRVAGIQIQSRPQGQTAWTEMAALYDPKAGVFTFSSNAPGIAIEVQARYRMTNAVYSPWVKATITTVPVIVRPDWSNVQGPNRPQDNATVGAPLGTEIGGRPVAEVLDQLDNGGLSAEQLAELARIEREAKNAQAIAEAKAQLAIENAETARLASEAATVARTDAQSARDKAVEVSNSVTDQTGQLRSKISSVEAVSVEADRVLATRATSLESKVGSHSSQDIVARIAREETTRASKDDAIGLRVDSLVVRQGGLNSQDIKAQIEREEVARTTTTDALASRTSTLEAAQSGSANLLMNTDWATGTEGWGYAADTNISQARDTIAGDVWRPLPEHNLGIFQAGTEARDPYWYSDYFAVEGGQWYECSAWLAGHRCVAHVYMEVLDRNGQYIGNTDSTGLTTLATGGQSLNEYGRRWNKSQLPMNAARARFIWQKTRTIAGFQDSYAWMTRPYVGKCKSTQTEPSTFSHGSSGVAVVTTNARIAEESRVRAEQDSAIANRTSTLESRVGGHNSSDIVARLGNEETVRANAVQAITERTVKLESRATSRPNLLPNGDFTNGMRGWNGAGANFQGGSSPYWGPYVMATGGYSSNVITLFSDLFPLAGNVNYTASADLINITGAQSPSAYIDLICYDGNRNVVADGPQRLRGGSFDFTDDNTTREATWVTTTTPGNTVYGQLRAVFQSTSGLPSYVGMRQAKVEFGNSYTTFSAEATVVQNAGTLIDTRNRVSTAWLENTVSAGTGQAKLALRADGISNTSAITLVAGRIELGSENNSIPALVVENGDVVFSGKLRVGTNRSGSRIEITDQTIQGYDGNNRLRFRLSGN